jgi:hypothetical protein
MRLLAHVLEGGCEDADCELHNMEVAAEERVASDIHRAAWLAGYEAAIARIRDLLTSGDLVEGDNVLDELLGEARTTATKGL